MDYGIHGNYILVILIHEGWWVKKTRNCKSNTFKKNGGCRSGNQTGGYRWEDLQKTYYVDNIRLCYNSHSSM